MHPPRLKYIKSNRWKPFPYNFDGIKIIYIAWILILRWSKLFLLTFDANITDLYSSSLFFFFWLCQCFLLPAGGEWWALAIEGYHRGSGEDINSRRCRAASDRRPFRQRIIHVEWDPPQVFFFSSLSLVSSLLIRLGHTMHASASPLSGWEWDGFGHCLNINFF